MVSDGGTAGGRAASRETRWIWIACGALFLDRELHDSHAIQLSTGRAPMSLETQKMAKMSPAARRKRSDSFSRGFYSGGFTCLGYSEKSTFGCYRNSFTQLPDARLITSVRTAQATSLFREYVTPPANFDHAIYHIVSLSIRHVRANFRDIFCASVESDVPADTKRHLRPVDRRDHPHVLAVLRLRPLLRHVPKRLETLHQVYVAFNFRARAFFCLFSWRFKALISCITPDNFKTYFFSFGVCYNAKRASYYEMARR